MGRVLAVTGKGGVGKTTVAALIIRHLRAAARGPILAVDADPDCNLARVLAIPLGTTIGDLREETLREIRNLPAGMSKENYIEAGLHQAIVETPKVDLISMGRGEGPGCYCFLNHVLRKFAEDVLPGYEWVVMDNEAGLENLSRRTASRIDHLIVVVNDNPLSVDCARRIDSLLADLGREVGGKHYVLNAAREDRAAAVRDRLADLSLDCLGSIPRDEAVEDAVFRGESIYELADGPATAAVERIMRKIGAA
jgi:CO dehydrogenase maturation factor